MLKRFLSLNLKVIFFYLLSDILAQKTQGKINSFPSSYEEKLLSPKELKLFKILSSTFRVQDETYYAQEMNGTFIGYESSKSRDLLKSHSDSSKYGKNLPQRSFKELDKNGTTAFFKSVKLQGTRMFISIEWMRGVQYSNKK